MTKPSAAEFSRAHAALDKAKRNFREAKAIMRAALLHEIELHKLCIDAARAEGNSRLVDYHSTKVAAYESEYFRYE